MALRTLTEPKTRCGLTLIELLVVIGILAVLIGLLLAAVQRARDAALRIECSNNLKQIVLGLQSYHDANGAFPPGMRREPDAYPYLSWEARLLPYLGHDPAWQQTVADFARQSSYWIEPRHHNFAQPMAIFTCKADGPTTGQAVYLIELDGTPQTNGVAFTHYLGVAGKTSNSRDGILYRDSQVRMAEVTDGASQTIFVGERPPSSDALFGWWYAGVGQNFEGSADYVLGVREPRTTFRMPTCEYGPYHFAPGRFDNPCDTFHFWSGHTGGANFAFGDGSIRCLSYSADGILPALASRAGGEAVP